MDERIIRLNMANGLIAFKLNFLRMCTKAQAMNRAFDELTSGRESAEAIALAIGNIQDLPIEEMNKLRDQCLMLSWMNLSPID